MYIQAFFLALVQSLTEFLPVSSSGHLILLHNILKNSSIINNLSFDVALHLGSVFAIIIYFWKDIKQLIIDFLSKDKSSKLLLFIIIAIIPAGFFGYFFHSFIEGLRSVYIVVVTLILGAILFILVEKFLNIRKNLDNIKLSDSIFIGIMQCLSFIPGVSRSGITISAGMMKGFSRVDAARFSFFMAIPLILGAFIKEITDIMSVDNKGLFVFGIFCSFVLSFISISVFMRFLKKYKLYIFAYYRIALALVILILLQLGKI